MERDEEGIGAHGKMIRRIADLSDQVSDQRRSLSAADCRDLRDVRAASLWTYPTEARLSPTLHLPSTGRRPS